MTCEMSETLQTDTQNLNLECRLHSDTSLNPSIYQV